MSVLEPVLRHYGGARRFGGQVNAGVAMAGVSINPGDFIYADATSIITSRQNLMDNKRV